MAGGRGKTTEERVEAAEEGEEREGEEGEEKPLNWPKSGKEKWTKHSVLPVLAFLAFLPNSLSLSLSVFDIMLEIIYHLNNNASNYVKMPYNRYDSWEGNAWGRRMIFFVADDCWGSALTGLGCDEICLWMLKFSSRRAIKHGSCLGKNSTDISMKNMYSI